MAIKVDLPQIRGFSPNDDPFSSLKSRNANRLDDGWDLAGSLSDVGSGTLSFNALHNPFLIKTLESALSHPCVKGPLSSCLDAHGKEVLTHFLSHGSNRLSENDLKIVCTYLEHISKPSVSNSLGLTPSNVREIQSVLQSIESY